MSHESWHYKRKSIGFRHEYFPNLHRKVFFSSARLSICYLFFHLKQQTMYNQSHAAKGDHYGSSKRHLLYRSMQRAAVNIYKTGTSYEMLVFAPGRIKEHFAVNVKGNELSISYTPPDGFPRFDWVLREYSRGGFVRTFTLDETIDASAITAKYEDGVLQVSLPVIAGAQTKEQEIKIS